MYRKYKAYARLTNLQRCYAQKIRRGTTLTNVQRCFAHKCVEELRSQIYRGATLTNVQLYLSHDINRTCRQQKKNPRHNQLIIFNQLIINHNQSSKSSVLFVTLEKTTFLYALLMYKTWYCVLKYVHICRQHAQEDALKIKLIQKQVLR